MSTSISLGETDAQVLAYLQTVSEPVFLGKYTPQVNESDDLSALTDQVFQDMEYEEIEVAFTLWKESISGLYLNLEKFDFEVIKKINKRITKLSQLHHLVVQLPEEYPEFNISSINSLIYLELIKRRYAPIQLPNFSSLGNLAVLIVRGTVSDPFPTITTCAGLLRFIMKTIDLTSFPNYVTELENLLWLEIGGNFKIVPPELGNLHDLRILELTAEKLESLPEELEMLTKLGNLSIESSVLTDLPHSLGNLQNLTDLYLWNLPISTIPDMIFKLTTLQYFWIKDNTRLVGSLQTIPPEIGMLVNLKSLELNGHKISILPETIGNLLNLQILNLGINNLSAIPSELSKLKALKKLELYANHFSEFPAIVCTLESLEYLDISDNPIKSIPPDIAKLSKLHSFDAIDCPLEEIPVALTNFNIDQIEYFVLSVVDITAIPVDIQTWLEKLVKYSNENQEKGIQVEISQYEKEEEQ